MATKTFSVTVHVAWWLRPYLQTLVFFCIMMRSEPDQERLARVIRRALSVKARAT